MNREQAETLLAVLVADELDEPVRGELLAYLKTDPALAERVGDMRAAAGLARAGLEREAEDTPASLGDERRAALLSLAEREPITATPAPPASPAVSAGPPSTGTPVLFTFRAAGAAAACVAMGVGLIGLALPELGVARRSARRMMNAPMSPPTSEAPEYAYGSADGAGGNWGSDDAGLVRRPQTQAEMELRSGNVVGLSEEAGTLASFTNNGIQLPNPDRSAGAVQAAEAALRETTGTLALDAPSDVPAEFFADARATNDDVSRDASPMLGAFGQSPASESRQGFDTRYRSAALGDADGDGWNHQSDLTGRYLADVQAGEGLAVPDRSREAGGAAPPAPPTDPAELDRWASANGVALGTGLDDRRAGVRFADRGETQQEEILYPGLADAPEGFDIGGGPSAGRGDGGLPDATDGLPDNGRNWGPATVTGNASDQGFSTAPAFDLNEALSNSNLPGQDADTQGGRGGRGGGGGGGLFGDDNDLGVSGGVRLREPDPFSSGLELPMAELPDVSLVPGGDLLAPNDYSNDVHRLSERLRLNTDSDPTVGSEVSEILIARQEPTARYERAMRRAQQAQANGEYDAAMDAVIEARTLLNANRSAFSEAERNDMVGRAARMQSGINESRAMDEAQMARSAEREQSEMEMTARGEAEGRRAEQVQERLRRARALQMERRYDEALDELEAAQFIDPDNQTVAMLHNIIVDTAVGTESVRLRRQLDLMRSNQQLINDEATIPYDELLTYPGEWPELTQMRLAALDGETGESEANRTTQLAMRRILNVDFENQTLADVVEHLRDTTGVDIAVNWPALELSGVTPDTPVTLSLSRIPAELALKLALEQAGAESFDDEKPGYSIVEGILQVSTLADLKTATQVGLYDIRALFEHIPAEERADHVAELMQLIQDTVGDTDEWLDEESTIRELNGNLIVKTTPENHRALVALIERLGYDAERPEEDPAADPAIPPVNPWVLTAHDAQSTFALDTDTASYELARRTIVEQAQLPAIASVRMEEFVNRFDYQYPAGRDAHDTFTVHAEAGDAPFAEDGVVLVKVGVRGRVVARDQMKPAHYVFVIDASGSMAREDRLPLVRQSLAMLLGQLGERDTVSLVSYDTRPFLLLEHAPASDPGAILDAAATIQTGGSTNLSDGLRLGYQVAARHFAPGSINRVILCSDGVANVGDDDAQQMLDAAEAYRRQGVTLMTVGVGVDGQSAAAQAEGDERFNDGLLEQLANRGDGRYVYLGSVADAQRQLVEDLAATRPTIAYDAKIQVVFDPARVRRYRLIGYENRDIADQDFRNDAVDAGEVGSGQSATALYEVELYPAPGRVRPGVHTAAADSGGDLGSVFVRYRDAETDQVRETETPLSAGIVRERTVHDDPRFYLAACAAEFAELLRESGHAKDGSFARLHRLARQVAEALPLDRDAAELADLIGRSDGLPRAGQ